MVRMCFKTPNDSMAIHDAVSAKLYISLHKVPHGHMLYDRCYMAVLSSIVLFI